MLILPPRIDQIWQPPPEAKNWGKPVSFDGVEWTPTPGVQYRHNYYKVLSEARNPPAGVDKAEHQRAVLGHYIKHDLHFFTTFVMRIPPEISNHRFWVHSCWDVDTGPDSHTLDLWSREHGKSSIITIAKTIQDLLKDPEQRIGIFSYSKPAAVRFIRNIKWILEDNRLLKFCFPHVLYENPASEAQQWSDVEGIVVKRKGYARETSVSGHGLLEGMPVGSHFTVRVYDDVEVPDFVGSPEVMDKLCESFDLSKNLGTLSGWERVIGTTYHHNALLTRLRERATEDGTLIYKTRVKAATLDGTFNGPSVFLPEKRLVELRTNRKLFYAQQLLDPTPLGEETLNPALLEEINPGLIPPNIYKFMVIDPAGHRESDSRQGDSWGILVVGVEPCLSELGLSNLYIIDACIEPMQEAEALDVICKMYLRNGRIMRVGVEKTGLNAIEIHVANALRTKGRVISIENGTLVSLRPGGRNKKERILQSLQWPLNNSKIKISSAVPRSVVERLRMEMQRLGFWHEDGIDALSYVYDLLRGYRFGSRPIVDGPRKPNSIWDIVKPDGDEAGSLKWMTV